MKAMFECSDLQKVKRSHLAWEQYHDQYVPKGYHIHHKDNNRQNDDSNNLQLVTASEHATITNENRRIVC